MNIDSLSTSELCTLVNAGKLPARLLDERDGELHDVRNSSPYDHDKFPNTHPMRDELEMWHVFACRPKPLGIPTL